MDIIKQMRVRFSGVGQENREEIVAGGSFRDRRIPILRTQSFKGEKKNYQNWLRRQFIREMSIDLDPKEEVEYSTAVAAAAFAIYSLEQLHISNPNSKPTSSFPNKINTKIEQDHHSSEASMTKKEGQEKRAPIRAGTIGQMPEKSILPTAPSVKNNPNYSEYVNVNDNAMRKPEFQPIKPPQIEVRRQSSPKEPRGEETEADAWERAELAKIKERYESQNNRILDWENKKKAKAKRHLDRKERAGLKNVKTQSELERRRAKAVASYRGEVERIGQIADGARAQAVENRRNEEFKAKDKANHIRVSGELPPSCLCF